MPDKPKAQRIADHEAAQARAAQSEAMLADLTAQLAAAQAEQRVATEAASAAHAEAFDEEIAAETKRCKDNEDRHHAQCLDHASHVASLRRAREASGQPPLDPTAVGVITVDGKTHPVVSAHELFLGTKGLTGAATPKGGSRYTLGCGMTCDAAHDELDHERFDQTKAANCPRCADAIAMMDSGELPDARGDYLSSKEQIAHAKAENAKRNAQRSR